MKRVLFAILASCSIPIALAAPELRIGEVNAKPGSQVLVPLEIIDGELLSALELSVHFDPAKLSVDGQDSVRKGPALQDHSVLTSWQTDSLRVVILSSSVSRLDSGILLWVDFKVSQTSTLGETVDLTLTSVQGAGVDATPIAVVTQNGAVALSEAANQPKDGENELIFPHIAYGNYTHGSFYVTIALVNRTHSESTGRINFFKTTGAALPVTLSDGRTASHFDFTLPPMGSLFLQTVKGGELATGYARLSSTAPLGGTLMFSAEDLDGKEITEAGLSCAPLEKRFSVPVILDAASNTGVAFANTSDRTSEILLSLKNESGTELERESVSLAPGEQLARYVTDWFETLTPSSPFLGSVEVSASQGVSAVAVKEHGAMLTTFPVVVLD
jgi:hypothetical protein